MNIVYHFRVRGTGAEGVHIAGIANGLRAFGHEVHFVSPSSIDPTTPAIVRQAPPSTVVRLLHFFADRAPQIAFEAMELAYNAFAIPKLAAAVRAQRADLVYERYAFFNAAGSFVAPLFGVPHVIEVNELAGYERVRDQRLVGLARAIERRTFRRASLIVTVSDFLSQRVRELTAGLVRVVTIPNGVSRDWLSAGFPPDDAAAYRERMDLIGKPVLGFVGGLVHWHNFDLLLESFATARRTVPELVLLLVGDGPERAAIEAKAAELGVAAALRFAGRVSHRETAQLISLCDVTVVPQTNAYRSPIKLFEYMALGKLVVAPRMPPIQSVLDEGRTGLMFEPGNRESFAATLSRAFLEPELAAQMGERARQCVVDKYLWDGHARRILELVREERRARRPALTASTHPMP
jgi:glycosyltransferase involved in cell wall biosynthesis